MLDLSRNRTWEAIDPSLPLKNRAGGSFFGLVRRGGGIPHSKGVWGSAVSSPTGVWGGAPAALQLSHFLSQKTHHVDYLIQHY